MKDFIIIKSSRRIEGKGRKVEWEHEDDRGRRFIGPPISAPYGKLIIVEIEDGIRSYPAGAPVAPIRIIRVVDQ